jgi:hypothetical protein
MKKVLTAVALSLLLAASAALLLHTGSEQAFAAGPTSTAYFITAANNSDPCENVSVLKSSASVAITSATTTNLVSAVSGDYISVCNWQVSVVGTSPTVQFEYGTTVSTACDTGATALTGAMAIPTTTLFTPASGNGLKLRVPVSQQLCLVSGGTITGIEGYITYVQAVY